MTRRDNYGFRRQRELQDHFANHEDDENRSFGSVDEYGGLAEAFLDLGPADDVDECTRRSGVVARYHRITQEFMLVSPDGFIITYYFLKPKKEDWLNNRAYFRTQCLRP